jgi:hypothetical protein
LDDDIKGKNPTELFYCHIFTFYKSQRKQWTQNLVCNFIGKTVDN